MNPAKCDELDYIHLLVAAQRVYSCSEAPAHDSFTRLLTRQPADTEALWQQAQLLVQRDKGVLMHDDTTLDKPYSKHLQLVHRHWSGKHHRVVAGINLSTLLWTDGEALIPTDFRVYDQPQGVVNLSQDCE